MKCWHVEKTDEVVVSQLYPNYVPMMSPPKNKHIFTQMKFQVGNLNGFSQLLTIIIGEKSARHTNKSTVIHSLSPLEIIATFPAFPHSSASGSPDGVTGAPSAKSQAPLVAPHDLQSSGRFD